MRTWIDRVDVHADALVVAIKRRAGSAFPPKIRIDWKKPPSKLKREILLPSGPANKATLRPIRSDARERLIKAIAQGRRWLNELVTGKVTDIIEIAVRDCCSVRSVNMTVSLAFLAPSLVEAIIEGTLPRDITCASFRLNGLSNIARSA